MKSQRNTIFWLRIWIAAICLVLPSLTLVPFGGIWLWQHGYVLYWVVGACSFVVIAFLVQLHLFSRLDIPLRGGARTIELPQGRRGLDLDAARERSLGGGSGNRRYRRSQPLVELAELLSGLASRRSRRWRKRCTPR